MPSLVPSPERQLLFRSQRMGSTMSRSDPNPKRSSPQNGGTPRIMSVVSTNSNKPPGQKPGDAGQETSAKANAPTTATKVSIVPISNSTSQKAGDSPGEPKHYAETSHISRSKTGRFSTSSNSEGTKPSKADELQKGIENAERMKKPTGTKKQIADDLVLPNTTDLKKTPSTKKKRVAPQLEASEEDIRHKKARTEDADEVSSVSSTKRRSTTKNKVQDTVDLTLHTTLGTSIPTRDMLRRYYGWEWKYGKLDIAGISHVVIQKYGEQGNHYFEGWDSLVSMWNDPGMGETWAPQPTESMTHAMEKIRMGSTSNNSRKNGSGTGTGTGSSSSGGSHDIRPNESIKSDHTKRTAAVNVSVPVVPSLKKKPSNAVELQKRPENTKLKKPLDTKKKRAAPELGASDSLSSTIRRSARSANKKKVQDTVDVITETSENSGRFIVPSRTELRLWYGWKWKYGAFGDVSFVKLAVDGNAICFGRWKNIVLLVLTRAGISHAVIQKYGEKGNHYFEGREALEEMWKDPGM
eukprot:scaffold147666_cov50-Attheya_sp.AAC.3